jgi:hypothetical protein
VRFGHGSDSSDKIPTLSRDFAPPLIRGPAALMARAFAGESVDGLLAFIERDARTGPEAAALALDTSFIHQLAFARERALSLQTQALCQCPIYRVVGAASETAIRVLAIMAPGDFMVNTPLDFATCHLDVRLDLLYVLPGRPLPAVLPDHDVASFAVSESDLATLDRLMPLCAAWPRPTLNDPSCIPELSRTGLAQLLAGVPGVRMAPVAEVSRADLMRCLLSGTAIATLGAGLGFPVLLRPGGGHAGAGLVKADTPADLLHALYVTAAERVVLAGFEDYASADGMFRKYRIAMVAGEPLLCHMAVSERWMIHYLNAGMTQSAERRAEEAAAMAGFDAGFAARHGEALAAMHARIGLDVYSIDCAETRDGALLVFEADVAAIIHMMDPPDLFPYKAPQMRRVFAALFELLRSRAGAGWYRPMSAPARSGRETAAAHPPA